MSSWRTFQSTEYSVEKPEKCLYIAQGDPNYFAEGAHNWSYLQAPSPSSLIPFDRDCGYKKGCFPACHSGCKYLVTWHAHDDKIDFQLQMKLTNTDKIWIGVGFSPTGKMVRYFVQYRACFNCLEGQVIHKLQRDDCRPNRRITHTLSSLYHNY